MSRGRYVDPTIPRATSLENFTDDLDTTDTSTTSLGINRSPEDTEALSDSMSSEISGSEVEVFITDGAGVTDQVLLLDDGIDYVSMSEALAFTYKLGFTDTTGLNDLVITLDKAPVIGMSRPYSYDLGWRDIINKVTTTVEKRYLFAEEVVWEDKDTRTIFQSENVVYQVNAEDPFIDAVTPVPGIKMFSGSDQIVSPEIYDFLVEEGEVSVSISRTSGQSLEITVTALNNEHAVISGMQLRAKPAKVVNTYFAREDDFESQTAEGVKTPSNNEKLVGRANINDSKALMEIIINQRFKKLPFVTFSVKNGSALRLRSMLDLRLSDRVSIIEDETFTQNSFYIEQIAHSISDSGTYHETVIGCEQIPVPIEGAFTFDDPDLGFDEGVFGDRANRYDFDDNLFVVGQSTLDGSKVLGL